MSPNTISKASSDDGSGHEKPVGEMVMGELVALDRTPAFYEASTDEERALDKRINLKLDFLVLPLLAFNFMLCGMDKCTSKMYS